MKKKLFKFFAIFNFILGISVFLLYYNGYFTQIKSNETTISPDEKLLQPMNLKEDSTRMPQFMKDSTPQRFQNQAFVKTTLKNEETKRLSSSKSLIMKPMPFVIKDPKLFHFDTTPEPTNSEKTRFSSSKSAIVPNLILDSASLLELTRKSKDTNPKRMSSSKSIIIPPSNQVIKQPAKPK